MYIKEYARCNFNLKKRRLREERERTEIRSIFYRIFTDFSSLGISSRNIIILRLDMSALIIKYTSSLFSTCSADKNRGNAASCDVIGFKLEAAVEIFFLQLCRSTMSK